MLEPGGCDIAGMSSDSCVKAKKEWGRGALSPFSAVTSFPGHCALVHCHSASLNWATTIL